MTYKFKIMDFVKDGFFDVDAAGKLGIRFGLLKDNYDIDYQIIFDTKDPYHFTIVTES